MRSDPLLPTAEDDPATQKVLRAFVRDGRLTGLPAKQSRKLLLFERIVQYFEPGRTYDESEVNRVLLRLYDDYVALRRHLVDHQYLERDHGTYWRIGGRVDVLAS